MNLLGASELDQHFIVQPPLHFQRFTGGVSKISQASGREHCTYQKLILPVIVGHVNVDNKVINVTRSILDFTYMAQYPSLSEMDLEKMDNILSIFHQNKDIFLSNGACESTHFQIPKLHGLQHFVGDVHSGRPPDNFTTETPKSLHINMCKEPYNASNHHKYDTQILNYLGIHDCLAMQQVYEAYWVRMNTQLNSVSTNPGFEHPT